MVHKNLASFDLLLTYSCWPRFRAGSQARQKTYFLVDTCGHPSGDFGRSIGSRIARFPKDLDRRQRVLFAFYCFLTYPPRHLNADTRRAVMVPGRFKGLFNAKEPKMTDVIPRDYLDLFEKPAFAHLATLMKDGSPQVTPVWIDYDGKHILFNSALGRVKDKNVRRDPRVAMSIQDPQNPYRYLQIRGRVVSITQDGADEHINMLARKYLGKPEYPYRQPGEVRVLYRVEPEKVSVMG